MADSPSANIAEANVMNANEYHINGSARSQKKSVTIDVRDENNVEVNEEEEEKLEAIENELAEAGIVRPPDGGYGWIIVIASFFANVFVDGIIFTSGATFLPLWEKEYKTTSMAVSWTTSLLSGCYLLAGPLASALANYFGCRKVVIVGALIGSGGFLLSVLVPSLPLPLLYITFGVIGGIGFGLIYLPSIVIVGHYFSEKRALATGLAVCGSGIGTFLFAQINPFLLEKFNDSWRSTLTVIAGMVLFCIVCGAFFRTLKASSQQVDDVTEIAVGLQSTSVGEKLNIDSRQNVNTTNNNNNAKTIEMSSSPHVTQGIAIERFENDESQQSNGGNQETNRRINIDRPFLSTIELQTRRRLNTDVGASQHDVAKIVSKECVTELNRPLSRMDIFYAGSSTALATKEHTSSNEQQPHIARSRSQTKQSIMLSVLSLTAIIPINETTTTPTTGIYRHRWIQHVTQVLKTMLDFELLLSPSFLILAISGFLTLCCFFVPFNYIGEQARTVGVDDVGRTRLLQVLGLVNIVARILCGWLSDRPEVDALTVSTSAIIIGGISTIAVPHLTAYWMYIVYCILFAFGVACFAALRSIICVELLGIERLTNAYGFLLLFMGAAALVGTPIAGLLRDLTGDFNLSFYVMGALMTLSGVICIPLKRIAEWEKTKKQRAVGKEDAENATELLPLKKS